MTKGSHCNMVLFQLDKDEIARVAKRLDSEESWKEVKSTRRRARRRQKFGGSTYAPGQQLDPPVV